MDTLVISSPWWFQIWGFSGIFSQRIYSLTLRARASWNSQKLAIKWRHNEDQIEFWGIPDNVSWLLQVPRDLEADPEEVAWAGMLERGGDGTGCGDWGRGVCFGLRLLRFHLLIYHKTTVINDPFCSTQMLLSWVLALPPQLSPHQEGC